MSRIKVATIFSGIGAPEQALKRLGIDYDLVFSCDNGDRIIDVDYEAEYGNILCLKSPEEKQKYVLELYDTKTRKTNFVEKSYLANYDPQYFFEDVKLLDGNDFKGQIDLFVGGSPCQSFSIAGLRGGLKDTRGTLFYEFARLVSEISPKVFIYENVYGMINHDNGRTWNVIQNTFDDLGYYYMPMILNAKDFGIPQTRRRVFVVGFKNKEDYDKFIPPKEKELLVTVQDFLEDNCAIGSMQSVNGIMTNIDGRKGKPDKKYYLSEKLLKYCLSPGTKNFYHPKAETDRKVAFALLSTMGNHHRSSVDNYYTTDGHVRILTEREALRLMGFPDDYRIVVSKAQTYKQAGNSIVVDVMMNLLKQIISAEGWSNGEN